MEFAERVLSGVGPLLHQIITTEDEIPDWLIKVSTIIDDLDKDFAGNTVPSNMFSEE